MDASVLVGGVLVAVGLLALVLTRLRARTSSGGDPFDRTPDPTRTLTEIQRLEQRGGG